MFQQPKSKSYVDTAKQELLASFKEVTIEDQYTASVHSQVRAALDTIARRRCKHGVHFDNDDMDMFLGVVTKGDLKIISAHFVEELRKVWSNECSNNIGKSNAVKSSLQEKVLELIVNFVKHISSIEESYRNITIPPNSSIKVLLGKLHCTAKVDVSVQSRYTVQASSCKSLGGRCWWYR